MPLGILQVPPLVMLASFLMLGLAQTVAVPGYTVPGYTLLVADCATNNIEVHPATHTHARDLFIII